MNSNHFILSFIIKSNQLDSKDIKIRLKNPLKQLFWLRGPGAVFIWPIMEIDFIVFSDRREWDLPAAFYLIKNIDPSQSYRWSKVSANVVFYCMCDFQSRLPKNVHFSNIKIYLLHFWAIILKLSGYVLGMKITDIWWSKFWFRPLNWNYGFLKFSGPKKS